MFKFPDVARVTINGREVKGIAERAFSCIKEAAKLVAQIMQLARFMSQTEAARKENLARIKVKLCTG